MIRLIDADALRARFQAILDRGDMFCEYDIIGMVDNAPTVEITEEQAIDKLHDTGWLPLHDKEMTERPHGKWIPTVIDTGFFERSVCREWKCSNCGEVVNIKYPFCHCGADMRKEAENDTP